MTDDLRDLYQDVILDHGKRPRNARTMEPSPLTLVQPAHNPLCGDKGTLYVKLDSTRTRIEDASYVGQGCSISTASASLMTETLKGKNRDEALKTFGAFHEMITAPPAESTHRTIPELGKLAVFSGVAEFPARVKCASLAWHALKGALAADSAAAPTTPVSTE